MSLCLGNKPKLSVFICIGGKVGGCLEKPMTITKERLQNHRVTEAGILVPSNKAASNFNIEVDNVFYNMHSSPCNKY